MNSMMTPSGVGYAKQARFFPYANNGGTILAIAGDDFAVVASDTRLSDGFMIHSRDIPKAYRLTDKTVLVSTGFHADVLTLTKLIEARLKMYEHEHGVTMSTSAIAAMLSTILYYRRFFPYYVYNIIGGIDDEGRGCVYSFDPVGSYEREVYRAGGSAGAILQPLLDNQIGKKNMANVAPEALSVDRATQLVTDVFMSAAERDIYTGDSLHMEVIRSDGTPIETRSARLLRRD